VKLPVPLVAIALALLGPPVLAATLTLGASKDNTLYETLAQETPLSDGLGPHLYAGRVGIAGGDRIRRGLIAFDLSTLPAGAVVTGVQLTLNLSRTSPTGPATIQLHRATRNWGQGPSNAGDPGGSGAVAQMLDATWFEPFFLTPGVPWTTPGGDFVATPSASLSVNALQAYTFGSTPEMVADVQSWLQDPASNAGWAITGDETVSGTAKRFDTRDNGFAPFRPSLLITFNVPEPTTALTLTCFAAFFTSSRRRRAPGRFR
jgi:hypothetical protein